MIFSQFLTLILFRPIPNSWSFNFFMQVHKADHSELSEENAKKFVYDYLTRRLTGRRLK